MNRVLVIGRWARWPQKMALLMGTVIVLLASVGLAGEAFAAGENRSATASKTSGLDPSGETVTVTGSGFDSTKGIYVTFCVDNGAGQMATPCLGGVDMEGSLGSSVWISSNPPSYGEDLAQPFDPDGSFEVSLQVAASDEFVDCQDAASAPNGCVIFVRADHTRAADRSQDFRIPVTFAAGGAEETSDNDAKADGDDDETGSGDGGSDLASTGTAIAGLALAAGALIAGGVVLTVVRRKRKGHGAIAALSVLALSAVTLTAAPSTSAQAAELPSTDGTLAWGVRASFQNYVTGPIAGGTITTGGGASADGSVFAFPDASGAIDPDTGAVDLSFAGSVHFEGHDHGNGSLLDITLSNLRVVADGGSGSVSADIASRPFQGIDPEAPPPPIENHSDVELVTLDLSDQDLNPDDAGVVTVTDAATTLTEAGSAAFAGFYPDGDAFDPLSFTVTVDTGPEAIAPVVTARPSHVTAEVGQDATFSAAASGEPTPTVAWETRLDGPDWTAVEGATSPELTVPDVTLDHDGRQYRAVFTNDTGSATSEPATLTVAAPEPAPVTVTVDPATDLPATGAEVTVTGSGFATSGSGVYVGVGPADVTDNDDWFSNASYYAGVQWVRVGPGGIDTDGAFTAQLTFDAVFESGGDEVDCTVTECGLYTFAAHGSTDRSQDTYTPVTFETGSEPVWEPSVELFDESGAALDVVPAEGATVTVRGVGFDPNANLATRPPVTAGEPTGVYVVFGDFDADWRLSDGAPTSARTVHDQQWALPAASRDQVSADFPGQADQLLELKADGTFEATLDIAPVDDSEGLLGVYTYAAGGATPNASQEMFTPVSFGNAGTPQLDVDPATDILNGDTIEVEGTGYAPNRWLYVAITPQGESGDGNPTPFAHAKRIRTGSDGAFTTTLEDVQAQFTNEGVSVDCTEVDCFVASFSSPLESDNAGTDHSDDRRQDVFVPVAFAADPGPGSDPDPDPDPNPTPDGPVSVSDGVLDWGLKESFRTYITGPIAHGSWEVTGGATEDGTPFRFSNASGTADVGASTADAAFDGSVRFTGHDSADGPLLDLTVSNPRVKINGGEGSLLLDVKSKGLDNPNTWFEETQVEFATLDLSGVELVADDGVVTLSDVPATLTADGSDGFAGFYEAGAELDPVTLVLALDDAQLPDNPPGGNDDDSDGNSRTPATTAPDPAKTTNSNGLLPNTGAGWALTALAAFVIGGTGVGLKIAARSR